jgi:hypothetical protein
VEAVGGAIALDENHRPGARFVVWLPTARETSTSAHRCVPGWRRP